MRSRSFVLALVLAAAACTTPPPNAPSRCPEPTNESAKTSGAKPIPASPAASTTREGPGLDVTIRPVPSAAAIDVTLAFRGADAFPGRAFSIRTPDPKAFRMKEARDARGPIDARQDPHPDHVTIELSRAPEGELRLAYSVESRVTPGKLPLLLSDPDRLEVTGDALLLPDAARDLRLAVKLEIDLSPYGTLESGASVSGAATSFGIGASREVNATADELRGAVMVTGRMGTAVFDTLEGHDEAAWFGYTAFDPRPVSADTAAFRTAAGELFGERSPIPQTFLIVPEPGPVGRFVAARRTRSVLLHVAVGEPWSGPLRIATSVEMLRAWVGERLWIGPEDPARQAEGAWFAEGVVRHLARDMLFRFGLVTPLEVADEVNGLESVIATSPRAKEGNAALAKSFREPGVVPLLVARGALYALHVDAAIRAKSGGQKSLQEVLRALYAKAKERRGPLPVSAWISALTAEIGPAEADVFAEAIERGGKLDLPDSALGPCFRRETRRYERYDLGFDEVATRAKTPPVLVGVRPDGPAAKAGLREGDELVEGLTSAGRSDVPVTIVVQRGDDRITAKYRPAGPSASGRGWSRRKDVPDEKCTQ
ncbi:hypothetical protein [Polyangium sp. 15x6]|uniref:hypothetical protein n=1 Tax=Polyangium sp. 15x6 TaxID=3042687 RepID=UPI00249A41BA|nr:hypothetical protein [Polyangium sp. 15x6]MDI3287987.1 hypothetical protein [Polyangium sp. 15x6]